MQDLNWNVFKFKFNNRESKAFETLCYRLFCREFKVPLGIFRYKNQIGVETEPILVDGHWIGFQAKFFDHTIDKQEITSSIEKANVKNPDIKKIYVYLNLEFSESTKPGVKDAQTKVAIEAAAAAIGLQVVWRVPSHIEAQLSLPDNKVLAEYFFSLEKGMTDWLEELEEHSWAILKPIHAQIDFDGFEIRIDRSDHLIELKSALQRSPLVIVSGAAGVGKTALLKEFVNSIAPECRFFLFKASEFNVSHINEVFHHYGTFSLIDFIREHEDVAEKYVIVDSAEKLSDLENEDPFREFLSTLLKHGWKIVFTTRFSYLDDLKFQFVEIYRVPFEVVLLNNIEPRELEKLSSRYNFSLPSNQRLVKLLGNPFYLNEYLKVHAASGDLSSLSEFKELLWDKQIAKSTTREACFIAIAKRRADTGRLLVTDVSDCGEEILRSLASDEIIERDTKTNALFITHDIYEEWALEKVIDRSFYNAENNSEFFNSLGTSLPIRRSFRVWLSEKLLHEQPEIKPLIEASFTDEKIENHWKDEILIAVLLSDYSEVFFEMFEKLLLKDDQRLLLRALFLLRIACKEINDDLLQVLGMNSRDIASLTTIFTRPKGTGWNCAIAFLHRHKEKINPANIDIILPILEAWNDNIRTGPTTRSAGLLALYYYQEADTNLGTRYHVLEDRKKDLTKIILNAASELKEELTAIFEKVVAEKSKNYRSQYYEMIQIVLSSATDSFEVAQVLPEQVIALADLFWFEDPREEFDDEHRHSMMIGVEPHFCISSRHREYYPASAFQTPTFQLLRFAPKSTLDFIISFTNKAVKCYSQSEFANEVREVEVHHADNNVTKQWISSRLWNAYRGNKVSTSLLESMHMALEKWLLDFVKQASVAQAEDMCADLLKRSRSASITGVLVSVVLSQPSKLFNVAKVLFRTREFFLHDSERWMLDQRSRSHYSFLSGLDSRHKLYEDERLRTCDDPHRKLALEHLAFQYQFVKWEEDDDQIFQSRQAAIWEILDNYYSELPAPTEQTETDKTWRMYLARMDRRKMAPEVEQRDGQILVQFVPEIDSELKKFSEDSVQESSGALKYVPLQSWADARFRREKDEYAKYEQYETNPHLAFTEAKEIIDSLSTTNPAPIFSRHVPAYTSAVLLRDFEDTLNGEEKTFCKDVILEFASLPIRFDRYCYQTIDGTEPTIRSLTRLIELFPADKQNIKLLLLLLLLSPFHEISVFAARSILNDLWKTKFEDAQSLLLGFLFLRTKVSEVTKQLMKEKFEGKIVEYWGVPASDVIERMLAQFESEFERIISNEITLLELPQLETLSLRVLNRAFELLPPGTTDESHKMLAKKIIAILAQRIFKDRDEKRDYALNHNFFDKLAYFVLMSEENDIREYMKPLVEHFRVSRDGDNLFARFISAEDVLRRYNEFWIVWEMFYERIREICIGHGSSYDVQSVIHNYLLAWPYWNENIKEWPSLRNREKLFFEKVSLEMGHHPSVLYSIARLLNEIGSNFLNEGIGWISQMVNRNPNLLTDKLDINTLYYIEKAVRKYVLLNRGVLKASIQAKSQLLHVLNFLVDRGSVTGYLVREDVL
jgi:hypothetical protein